MRTKPSDTHTEEQLLINHFALDPTVSESYLNHNFLIQIGKQQLDFSQLLSIAFDVAIMFH